MDKQVIACPDDARYSVVLDASEVFPEDPGQGTPAMVNGPHGVTGTYWCVVDTGEMADRHVPSAILRWLESIEDEVNAFVESASDEATAPRR